LPVDAVNANCTAGEEGEDGAVALSRDPDGRTRIAGGVLGRWAD